MQADVALPYGNAASTPAPFALPYGNAASRAAQFALRYGNAASGRPKGADDQWSSAPFGVAGWVS